ncbi:hypothetical protein QMG83_12275 [Salinibacterium sp. G-O1]|uniref:hypothetical protein n=1 Tax=Salinibacterium sp. G-O1 TaxID=3046208 RepID=UPI0024B8D614|nr:hypothetical protein [Salinibacterium sp. G-O1]MDJ0336002.1 hypothetical protein [Salinibacterium sp. G-O1]
MIRMILEFVSAGIFLILAIVTAMYPPWIEAVFGIDPDQGSGALEWALVAAFGVVALIAAGLGTRTVVLRARAREA